MVASYTPYSSALFDLAVESKQEDFYLEQLQELTKIWNENGDFKNALCHPKITKAEKTKWICELFENKIDNLLYRFLLVMIEHDVIAYIPEITDAYADILKEYRNIEPVTVESATTLNEKQLADIKAMLEAKLKKSVDITVKVNPELIAGLRVHTKDLELDNSVLSKVNGLKEKLSHMD